MRKTILVLLFGLTLCVSGFSQEAQKIDEFPVGNCEDYLARMDNIIVQSGNNPSAQVYVLIYEGKEARFNILSGKVESMFPHFGSAKAKIRSMKKYLALRKVAAESFAFIKAGFRENFMLEIWLVPYGVTPPAPTPTLTKMRYRKGKPYGFCLGCCEP